MDNANGAAGGSASATRAERFEDERRRIVESCFNKTDPDGSLLETYITHVRVLEYATHPSSPPPFAVCTPENQKPRVVIVSVRKNGRVRMHKSKENSIGTFSIGKTWNLDDLTHINSYTSSDVDPDEREWAGESGFAVTIARVYFWHAPSDREKKFFIASLIKIFGKYTGGRTPQLDGFSPRERDQVLGVATRSQPPPRRPGLPLAPTSPALSLPLAPYNAPASVGDPDDRISQSALSRPLSPLSVSTYAAAPAVLPQLPRAAPSSNGVTAPVSSIDLTRSQNQAALLRLGGSIKAQDPVGKPSITRGEEAIFMTPTRSRGGMVGTSAFGRLPPPLSNSPPAREGQPPPERRRPPMDPSRPQGAFDNDLVPAPLLGAGPRRDRTPNSDRDPGISPHSSERTGDSFQPTPPTSVQSATAPVTGDSPASATSEPEESRPGTGPMTRAKPRKPEILNPLWKVGTVGATFKPRPGGAGDRLRQAQANSNEPDVMTGVIPAPPRQGMTPSPEPQFPPPSQAQASKLANANKAAVPGLSPSTLGVAGPGVVNGTMGVPQVKVTVPNSNRPESVGSASAKEDAVGLDKANEAEKVKEEARRSVLTGNDTKYLAALGVDSNMLDVRSDTFTHWLDFFGWVPGEQMRATNVEKVRVDLDRELSKSQAGGWLSRFRDKDERVEAIKTGIDSALVECEELDNLLTLYGVELSTLSDDIAYIEAQGQGLQVQAANQKLLKKELESLLEMCAITTDDLKALRVGRLGKTSDLEAIESSLATLFKAMAKMDPSIGSNGEPRPTEMTLDSYQALGTLGDYGKMRIVQEKKEMYMNESGFFLRRLVDHMQEQFDRAWQETKRAMDGAQSRKSGIHRHDAGRQTLWMYHPMMLYARDIDLDKWNRLLQIYQDKSGPMYKADFRDVLETWKRNAEKAGAGRDADPSEQLLLFSSLMDKQPEGLATMAARKLTAKKSQNMLGRGFRTTSHDGSSKTSLGEQAGPAMLALEAFSGAVEELISVVETEQNFIVCFFHATTLEHGDFAECVKAHRPLDRGEAAAAKLALGMRGRPAEPDRELARRVTRAMEDIFGFLEQDLQSLIEWVLATSALQGAGVLAVIEARMADLGHSNQDFLLTMLQKLHDHLEGRFQKFVDQQIWAIEEAKVQVNKRRGVISFVRVFPVFSAAVENMLDSGGVDGRFAVRHTVDDEYDRILKAIFSKLRAIARDGSGGGVGGVGGARSAGPAVAVGGHGAAEAEDKEAINYHILMIENMNHLLEEMDTHGIVVLDQWRRTAERELADHLKLYLSAVMRRPLGKVLDYVENIEAQLQAGKSGLAVSVQPSNSKAVFNKLLGQYDAKEVRKGIEALRKRVEKHFVDPDWPAAAALALPGSSAPAPPHAQALLGRVLRECDRFYSDIDARISTITTNVYCGESQFEWPRAEAKAGFATTPGARLI